MVHDEEAEVSIRLATLIANSLQTRPAITPLHKPQAGPLEASGETYMPAHSTAAKHSNMCILGIMLHDVTVCIAYKMLINVECM